MEREDPGTVISDVSFARHRLRKSGLQTHEQRTEELFETLYTKTRAHFQRKQGHEGGNARSVADKKKTTRCADCKELGHWRGDPECKMVRAGQVP
eukprot:3348694-Amphidinium_carterae.1